MRAETRHQLKQDAFSRVTFDAAEKTADWTVAHRTTLIVSAVAIAIVLAAAVGGWYYLSAQDEKASFDFSLAVRTLDTQLRPAGTPAQPDVPSFTSAKERAEAAQKNFQAIVDKYPHTRTADLAHYFLGVTTADLSDNATAERNFKQVAIARLRPLPKPPWLRSTLRRTALSRRLHSIRNLSTNRRPPSAK